MIIFVLTFCIHHSFSLYLLFHLDRSYLKTQWVTWMPSESTTIGRKWLLKYCTTHGKLSNLRNTMAFIDNAKYRYSLSVCVCGCLSLLFVSLSLSSHSLSLSPSLSLPLSRSLSLFISLRRYLCFFLCVCLSVCLFIPLYMSLSLSLSLPLCLSHSLSFINLDKGTYFW